ncbi:hypothetical protein LTR10_020686 [Elasticomyces elasticus]|uniref:DUF7905 domain-containing protein n=1 Tax=Exophiala sideris TaxID=1016849 RepID=A0ABR0JIX3_9EURO|nr:hypothetical protein LTR10_020686 [Elasticomyces elasticus]KAK5033567.1 hypothetical protein LTS07_003872 [Exophiala sideris]KAK5041938.1 hypothetical protein LTR13_001743 [Exophiala sideris]KAK5064111.1 hypothetical protein LTR69_003880 [Exophiala sideris]KAK5185206.1 hypothetical protein LTR44_002194 [Eurotiomycetes sp. CCFEE 6388]
MSDHEGEGLDLERWEVASLPGGSIYSYAASDVFHQGVVPGETGFTGPQTANRRVFQDRNLLRRTADDSPRPLRHSQFGNLQARVPDALFINPAKHLFEDGQQPAGELQLRATWRSLQTVALRADRSAPHPLLKLQEFMKKFGTFIRKPEHQDEKLFIWGEPKEVAATQTALAEWQQLVYDSFASSKPSSWAKSHALDGRAEHRLERQTQQKALTDYLRQADYDYPVECALLWPKDMDIEEFEKLNQEVLEQLRSTFFCRITLKHSDLQHIMIEANYERDALQIMSRLLNLIKESISQRDELAMVNLVHLPDFDIYRDRVGLQDKDPRTQSYLPTLHGNQAPDEEGWTKERRVTHAGNRKKIGKVIDTSIKRLRISQQHVRLRAVFGELGFTLFQKPADGADTYSFQDFYTMVTKGRTKLHLNGLPVRQGDITDLPDILDDMEAFSERTETYGAFFDFSAQMANTTLRLDAVIYPNGDQFDIYEQRWVEFGDKVSKLQVSLFNFERPDFQITMDAFPLYPEERIKPQMLEFQHNLSFEGPPNGIKSTPRRRVKYSSVLGHVQKMSELTVIKWRFKNTHGTFEVRRKDVYDERPGRKSPGPIETRWHALYYYPEWDNLMGQFATVKPGEDITWTKSVATFFPESDKTGRALPQGFKNFITEVEEIQDLLAEAIGKLAKGKQKAAQSNGFHENGAGDDGI